MAEDLGLQARHAGPIDNSAVAESLTSVLILMNKRCAVSENNDDSGWLAEFGFYTHLTNSGNLNLC